MFNVFEVAGRDEGFWPKWGHYEDDGDIVRLNVIQDFGKHVQSRLSLSRATTFRDYVYLLSPVVNYTTNIFTQDYFNYAEDFEAQGAYLDNIAKFELHDIPLQTNFGYTWDRFIPENYTRNYIPKYYTGNLFAPDYSTLTEPRTSEGATGIVKGSQTTATSFYVLQTAELFKSKLILSGGLAYNKSVVESQVTGAVTTDQGEWVNASESCSNPGAMCHCITDMPRCSIRRP